MRSELKEDYLDASLSRGVWWEDHLIFGDMESYPHDFGNDLLLLIYVYMLFMLSFVACLVLLFIMPYAIFISPMTYMISI